MGRVRKGQFKETPVDELLNALFKVCYIYLHVYAEAQANSRIGYA